MDGAGLALFTGGFGYGEVLIILLALLLIFGPRLPQVARALGKSFSSCVLAQLAIETWTFASPDQC